MLTLFSIPKAFEGDNAVMQRNAIQSWLRLRPRPEIILFGKDKGTPETAAEFSLHHVAGVECNESGTPLVNSLFETAERTAANDVLCYINSDIILLSDFLPAVERVAQLRRRFLIGGQRWDVDIKEPLDFVPAWEEQVRDRVAQSGKLHGPTGIDYFVFSRGLWGEIPPFAIGRTTWDNWLLYRARARKGVLIDATPVVTAVHQNHGYSHVANGFDGAWKGPESKRNFELSGGTKHVFTLNDANFLLTPGGLKKPELTLERLNRQLVTTAVLRPYLVPFTWLAKLGLGVIYRLRRMGRKTV
jgi:hypothetical protein